MHHVFFRPIARLQVKLDGSKITRAIGLRRLRKAVAQAPRAGGRWTRDWRSFSGILEKIETLNVDLPWSGMKVHGFDIGISLTYCRIFLS